MAGPEGRAASDVDRSVYKIPQKERDILCARPFAPKNRGTGNPVNPQCHV